MKSLIFATGNQRKITEATNELRPYGIVFEARSVDINEIQHQDPAEITKAKAVAAYQVVQQPVVVSDTSWAIPALGGFPGGYMKDIADWWDIEDWLSVMERHDDRTIICYEHVAFYDGQTIQHFMADYPGVMTRQPRGTVQDNESFELITVLYGDQTMGEQLALGEVASAGTELFHWQQFAKWYSGAK